MDLPTGRIVFVRRQKWLIQGEEKDSQSETRQKRGLRNVPDREVNGDPGNGFKSLNLTFRIANSKTGQDMKMLKIATFCSVIALSACCLVATTASAQAQAQMLPSKPQLSDAEVSRRVDQILSQMTLDEKVGQLSIPLYFNSSPGKPNSLDQAIAKGKFGSVGFVMDAATANRLQKLNLENSRLKIPLLFGFDVVHGFRTVFPSNIGLAASWDPSLVKDVQAVAAREVSAAGVHWVFAPNVDIVRDPRFGRIVEGSGEDPYLGAAMAAAQVQGFQGDYIGAPGHVVAQLKHYAGYGAVLGGRDNDEVSLPETDLWNVYLPPFKAGIDAGAGGIMTAYTSLNGVPATGNSWLVTDVLRKTWGFKGFVSSDNNSVTDLKTGHHGLTASDADSAVRAINAGVDIEMSNAPAYARLAEAVASGKVSQRTLDDAVRRVLEIKIRLGTFERPYVDERAAAAILNDPSHRELARVAAQRSTVLLQNTGNFLPLATPGLKSIAVIGPLADSQRETLGNWVFNQDNQETVTILKGIEARAGKSIAVRYAEGVRIERTLTKSPFGQFGPPKRSPVDADAEFAKAVSLARSSDVVIMVLGENQDMTGEAASRATLDFPGRQIELLKAVAATGKPIVLVVMAGRPLDLTEVQALTPAIVDVWYPGTRGGTAVADILFGDVNPSGKLPITWPRNASQLPIFYNHLSTMSPQLAGRRYWDQPSTPLYPFGYGLSYTTFEYSAPNIDRQTVGVGETVRVTASLKNVGKVSGEEVAQLYIHQQYGSASRPVRELKGFQRVSLEPGETKTVTFTLSADELTYWSSAKKAWVLEASKFDVWIGGNSDTKNRAEFEVAGDDKLFHP